MEKFQNLIAGEWTDSGEFQSNVNPSDLSDVIGEYARADAKAAALAIEAADRAFPGWSVSSIQQRADILDKVGSAILARKEELGRLLAREEGKTLAEAIGEAGRAGQIFKYFAGEALRIHGEKMSSVRPGVEVEITREPVGVVGIITPWNFPIAIPAWKIAPALAFGNCVVFKPADLVPGCAWAIADLLHQAGIPKGVFNLVMGRGSVVGEAIVESPRIHAISFTGSVATGRKIAVRCAELGKKLQLEMGGKNPLVVLDDADLTVAVNAAVNGAYFSTGQRCTASSRLVVTAGIHDAFAEAMKEAAAKLVVGNALHPETQIGPVVDDAQLRQDLFYTDLARQENAEVSGGRLLAREAKGFYLEPALFLNTTNEMRINREEIFGPSASVIRVKDYEEALAVANDTEFGLCAGICTQSLKYASHFQRHAEAGMVMVNLPTAGVDYHVPFGGRKASSYGPREQGGYAREFYTTVKTTYLAP
ncbi:MAG: aldehyde dehydrogenase family protein [Bryobacterales bacterium]|nr:aldehyde dehydrogenase family protein [Bryobacterales bacterium]